MAEFIKRKRPISIREFMSLFKEIDEYASYLKTDWLLVNFPDLVVDVGPGRNFDIVVNSEWPHKTGGPQGNFVKIRREGYTIMQTFNFDLNVENPKTGEYVTHRKGRVTFYFQFKLKLTGTKFDWDATGGISHLKLMKGNEERIYE